MNFLPSSASDKFRHLRPPDTWQEMQNFCLDAFPLVQERFNTGRPRTANYWASSGYGKNGDSQGGVDIFDHFSTTTMQCKRVEKFDKKALEKELEALKRYRSALSAHFIVTSLEETNQSVIEHVRKLNDALTCDPVSGQVPAMLPVERLPKLYVLNWQDIKGIVSKDLFLAMKWRFSPLHADYPNLNGFNLRSMIMAANTMGCSIPPGGGGKTDRVLAAINAVTQSLDPDAIESMGKSERIASSTIHSLYNFWYDVNETWKKGQSINPAIKLCESLDGVEMHRGLSDLNAIVPFQARIEAFKYLNRLALMVRRLVKLIDNEHHFVFGYTEVEHEGRKVPVEDEASRYYNFTDDDTESSPWYIPREQVIGSARLIAREIRRVRVNIAPPR
ncbi:hypothetical protein ACVWZ9_001899 [Pseudomonas chlororaphis]